MLSKMYLDDSRFHICHFLLFLIAAFQKWLTNLNMKLLRSYLVDEATDLGHLLNIPQSFSTLNVQVLRVCFRGLIFCYSSLVVSTGFSARILREFLNYPIRSSYPTHFILRIFLGGVLLPRYFVGHCIYSLHVRFAACASSKTIETGDFLRHYST